jgi:hypothetical protein
MHPLASFFAFGRKATPVSSAARGGEAPVPLDEATFAAWAAWAARGSRDGAPARTAAGRPSPNQRHEPSPAAS